MFACLLACTIQRYVLSQVNDVLKMPGGERIVFEWHCREDSGMPTKELLSGKNIGDGFNFKVNIMSPCGDIIASLLRKTTWPLGPLPTAPKKRGKPRLTNPKKQKQSTKPAKGKKKMTKEDKANRVSLLQSQGALTMTMAPPRSTSSGGSLHLDLFAGPPPTLHDLCPPGATKSAFRRLQLQKPSVRRGPASTAGKQNMSSKETTSTKTLKKNDVRRYMKPTKPSAAPRRLSPPPVKKTETKTSNAGQDPFAFQHSVGDEPVLPTARIEDPRTEEIEDDPEPFRALVDSLGQSSILFRLQSTHLMHTSGNIATANTHHTTQT